MASIILSDQPASLLLIEYQTTEQAIAGAKSIQTAQEIDLVTARVQDNLLLTVFGKVDKKAIEDLVIKILSRN